MVQSEMKTLAIIGGGAAGLAAAVAAGERVRAADASLDIALYECDDRVGRSILATGNGRCNFSNENLRLDEYRNSVFVECALRGLAWSFYETENESYSKVRRDNGDDVHAFFYLHGLMWRVEDDGRNYPLPNKASVIVDMLRAAAGRVGVRECCGCAVEAVEPPHGEGGRFTLRMADGRLERADAVIVACGGRAIAALDACGCKVHRLQPILGPLRVADADIPFVRELDNIRVRCTVSLRRKAKNGERTVASEDGELLFRKYGVSGICVFNLSRQAKPGDILEIALLQCPNRADAEHYLYKRRKNLAGGMARIGAGLTYKDMLCGLVLPRLGEAVLKRAGIAPDALFGKPDVPHLAEILGHTRLEVAGIGDEDICQVRRGGLDVKGFDPCTMGACDLPGLFAAGEALDVDGPCGGYNLHWAWASGLLAGRSAAEHLMET